MKRRGFTLVEILTAVLLSVVVSLVTLEVIRRVTIVMERMSNRSFAWERGHNALSIIEPRAKHAAFGITYKRAGSVFSRSFGNGMNSPQPSQWTDRGPLQIWEGYPTLFNLAPDVGGVFRGRGLAVLYAVPSGLKAQIGAPVTLSGDMTESFALIAPPDEKLSDILDTGLPVRIRNDLRSWVTFPLMRYPSHAQYSAGKLTIRMADDPRLSATLYPYDELHFIRAERFYAQSGAMLSQELRTAWMNPDSRLEGVLEMWFEWTPSKKLLEAWILTTCGSSSTGRTVRPKDWPHEAPWRANFELFDVLVVKGSWLLKNM
jgi:prepilin-type N-terminal cleavage/methylation domain-containing protein